MFGTTATGYINLQLSGEGKLALLEGWQQQFFRGRPEEFPIALNKSPEIDLTPLVGYWKYVCVSAVYSDGAASGLSQVKEK